MAFCLLRSGVYMCETGANVKEIIDHTSRKYVKNLMRKRVVRCNWGERPSNIVGHSTSDVSV